MYETNFSVYGACKVWRQLQREGHDTALCTVAPLMRTMGLQEIIRSKKLKTTLSNKAAPCRRTTSTASSVPPGRFIKRLRSFVWLGFGCPGNARLPLWVKERRSGGF